ACDSSLMRVVFGPESTILDAGRNQRIFPAHQTRAIIARDRHCQFPGCDEPPQHGEIHHSLWWWKHHGKTNVSQGILLCWHHHGYVHDHNITITRQTGQWIFTTTTGDTIHPPYGADEETSKGDDPPDPSPLGESSDPLGDPRDGRCENENGVASEYDDDFPFEGSDWEGSWLRFGDPPGEQPSAPPKDPPTDGWTDGGDLWGTED
ncbi:MAG TPA: HNH endonuclease signature motif containing protein, partial [Beutenbergiaceae bacterium]|nr:HNH endonuclease signature motif containing protein [Beutenbergiaceae bacterium]